MTERDIRSLEKEQLAELLEFALGEPDDIVDSRQRTTGDDPVDGDQSRQPKPSPNAQSDENPS